MSVTYSEGGVEVEEFWVIIVISIVLTVEILGEGSGGGYG